MKEEEVPGLNVLVFSTFALKAVSPCFTNIQEWKVSERLLTDLSEELQRQLDIRFRRDPAPNEEPGLGQVLAMALQTRLQGLNPQDRLSQRKALKWVKVRVDRILETKGNIRNIQTVSGLLDIVEAAIVLHTAT